MIGRIQENKVTIPVEQIDEGFISDPENRTTQPSFGIASVQDSFDKPEQDSLFEQLGAVTKSVVDPIGYPGEEWLWENSEVH